MASGFDGIGFVLTDSGFAAFDIDDCIDAVTGAIHPWATDKIERSCSYAEVTPSKTGLRIIGLTNGNDGNEPLNRRFTVPNANGVMCELYRKAVRYITITGQQIGECSELANIDALLDETFAELDGGGEREEHVGERRGAGGDEDLLVDPDTIRMVLRFVKDDDGDEVRTKRIAIGRAIHRSTDGNDEGYEIWSGWLKSLGHWRSKKAQREWYDNFARGMNAERRVTFGTIVYHADRDTPGWRDQLDWDQRDSKFLNLTFVEDPAEPLQPETEFWFNKLNDAEWAELNGIEEIYKQFGIASPKEQATGAYAIKDEAPGLRGEIPDSAAFRGTVEVEAPPRPEPKEQEQKSKQPEQKSGQKKPSPYPLPQKWKALIAGAYKFPDETTIKVWDWLYGKHLLRDTVSGTVATGGTGKSSTAIAEALVMTSGRNLLGTAPPRPLRVAIINFEETRNTMQKRIAGAMKHDKLKPQDIGDRLFIVAKGELPEVNSKVATLGRYGVVRSDKVIQELMAYVRNNKIDVLIIDPFIATHGVHENDNVAIRQVVECFDTVAERGECAIDLYHHTRKLGGEETSDESARGARAFVDAIRAVRVLETMTKEEARKLNIQHPGYYFRSFSGKRNYAPPMSESTWFRFVSIDLDNSPVLFGGDQVGVVTSWQHPGAKELDLTPDKIVAIQQIVRQHQFREDVRATMWVGKAIALALGLDAATDREPIKKLLQRLFRDRFLQFEPGQDEHRHSCMFVVVGPGPSNSGRGSS